MSNGLERDAKIYSLLAVVHVWITRVHAHINAPLSSVCKSSFSGDSVGPSVRWRTGTEVQTPPPFLQL